MNLADHFTHTPKDSEIETSVSQMEVLPYFEDVEFKELALELSKFETLHRQITSLESALQQLPLSAANASAYPYVKMMEHRISLVLAKSGVTADLTDSLESGTSSIFEKMADGAKYVWNKIVEYYLKLFTWIKEKLGLLEAGLSKQQRTFLKKINEVKGKIKSKKIDINAKSVNYPFYRQDLAWLVAHGYDLTNKKSNYLTEINQLTVFYTDFIKVSTYTAKAVVAPALKKLGAAIRDLYQTYGSSKKGSIDYAKEQDDLFALFEQALQDTMKNLDFHQMGSAGTENMLKSAKQYMDGDVVADVMLLFHPDFSKTKRLGFEERAAAADATDILETTFYVDAWQLRSANVLIQTNDEALKFLEGFELLAKETLALAKEAERNRDGIDLIEKTMQAMAGPRVLTMEDDREVIQTLKLGLSSARALSKITTRTISVIVQSEKTLEQVLRRFDQ